MTNRFTVTTKKVKIKEGCWEVLRCDVIDTSVLEGNLIGSYDRNYSSLFNTFVPFEREGEWYALIGEQYNGFSIFRLTPKFERLYTTILSKGEFCPTDFYIPFLKECYDLDNWDAPINKVWTGYHAFLSGCFWGSEYETCCMYIDMTDLSNPVVKPLKDKEGYWIRIPTSGKLEDQISISMEIDSELFLNVTTAAIARIDPKTMIVSEVFE